MKKIIVFTGLALLLACQGKKESPGKADTTALRKRLTEFLQYNDALNIDKILDYIYPKLFTLVAREDMKKAMKDGFENESLRVDLEHSTVDSLYPVFNVGKARYAKVNYSMDMLMEYRKTSPGQNLAAQVNAMQRLMAGKYGPENVQADESKGTLKIHAVNNQMLALQESVDQPWYFINLKEGDPMLMQMVNKEVLDSLAAYR